MSTPPFLKVIHFRQTLPIFSQAYFTLKAKSDVNRNLDATHRECLKCMKPTEDRALVIARASSDEFPVSPCQLKLTKFKTQTGKRERRGKWRAQKTSDLSTQYFPIVLPRRRATLICIIAHTISSSVLVIRSSQKFIGRKNQRGKFLPL